MVQLISIKLTYICKNILSIANNYCDYCQTRNELFQVNIDRDPSSQQFYEGRHAWNNSDLYPGSSPKG